MWFRNLVPAWRVAAFVIAALLVVSCASVPEEQRIVTLQDSYTRLVDGMAEAALNDPGAIAFLAFAETGADAPGGAGASGGPDDTPSAPGDRFGLYYADGLATRLLSRHAGIEVVERTILEDVLAERGYNYTGILNQEKIENLQDFVPARYIATGSYTVLSNVVEVTVRLVDTRDATIAMSGLSRVYLSDDVRELLGLEPAEGSPSATAQVEIADVEGAMPEAEFQPILAAVAEEAFDDDRTAIVTVALRDVPLTSAQVYRIVGEFSFDDGRIATIRFLYPNIVDKAQAFILLELLSFQSSVDEVSEFMSTYRPGESGVDEEAE